MSLFLFVWKRVSSWRITTRTEPINVKRSVAASQICTRKQKLKIKHEENPSGSERTRKKREGAVKEATAKH